MDWTSKCLRIVQRVLDELGPANVAIFRDPVDAKVVPDYYKVIKNPMWLTRMQQKLNTNRYADPQGFCDVGAACCCLMPDA
jgi:hypothetical protein